MRPPAEHRAHAPREARCAVLTISDSRTLETDSGGQLLVDKLSGAGHRVVRRTIHPDEPALVGELVRSLIAGGEVDAIITTGGTGIGPRDATYEAVEEILEQELPGFGELFRFLSYREVGAAAMLSRATAGVSGGCVVIALPGSPDAVRLAMDELVLPELGHMVGVAKRRGSP